MKIKCAFCLFLVLIKEYHATELTSTSCGTCVCSQLFSNVAPPNEVSQGRPGKMGPPGSKGDPGVPGVPDEGVLESVVDKKILKLTERTADLEKTVADQNNQIEELQADVKTLLLLHQQNDCRDISGPSGIYTVYPPGYKRGLEVFCDQEKEMGGWTVIQRRINGSVDFYRDWDPYVAGFGDMTGEFWIGLEKLHRLTKDGNHELRVDLEDMDGNRVFAKYSLFQVGSASTEYTLKVTGYSGHAGNALENHNGQKFSTKDRDHDSYKDNCAILYTGAWWYNACHYSNLNGVYYDFGKDTPQGVSWYSWYTKYLSLKRVEMKIRPR